MAGTILDWRKELERWLKPFLERLGHKTRRRMCPVYISGLIGPGDRKSIQPMAERVGLGAYDQLHHFVSAGVWDVAPVETELLVQADKLVGGRDAVLVVDDTAVLKKGTHSVGVAPQYCSALGKIANCQTLVSLTLARGEVPVMAAMRLFLPESWTNDSIEASGRSSRTPNRTDEAGSCTGGDRSCDCGGDTVWLRTGGCRLRIERMVPPRTYSSQT
jgi:SRSO17 transposase